MFLKHVLISINLATGYGTVTAHWLLLSSAYETNRCSKSRLLLVCIVSVCAILCLCRAVCRVLDVIPFYYRVCMLMVVMVLLRMVGPYYYTVCMLMVVMVLLRMVGN